MRRRPVLVGGALVAVGVVIVAVCVVLLVREIARTPEWGPEPVFGVGGGVLLVIAGVGLIRDRRRFPPGYRADEDSGVPFPYTPPRPETGDNQMPSYGGGDSGGGGS
ncbi:hypothetical protein [Micromonospora chersina]|uniref:hypothetical protein n=1 Tax=Micromonospora chersina TaxID=47854 RepID=UPI00371DAFD4